LSCPICRKRKPKRFCPAKDEKICAVCCGTEREVTIDCPVDCPYLIAARRWENEHRKPLPAGEVPFPEVEFPADFVHERRAVVSGLGLTILKLAKEMPSLADPDALETLAALAETYRTLTSGIIYEKPPDGHVARELYTRLAQFLDDFRKHEAEHAGFPSLKNSEIFHLLVFLLRVGRHQTNGRPHSRAFVDFLRAQFPPEVAAEIAGSEPKIITP